VRFRNIYKQRLALLWRVLVSAVSSSETFSGIESEIQENSAEEVENVKFTKNNSSILKINPYVCELCIWISKYEVSNIKLS